MEVNLRARMEAFLVTDEHKQRKGVGRSSVGDLCVDKEKLQNPNHTFISFVYAKFLFILWVSLCLCNCKRTWKLLFSHNLYSLSQ